MVMFNSYVSHYQRVHSENIIAGADSASFTPERSMESWCCLGCYLGSGRAHSWSRSGAEVYSLRGGENNGLLYDLTLQTWEDFPNCLGILGCLKILKPPIRQHSHRMGAKLIFACAKNPWPRAFRSSYPMLLHRHSPSPSPFVSDDPVIPCDADMHRHRDPAPEIVSS